MNLESYYWIRGKLLDQRVTFSFEVVMMKAKQGLNSEISEHDSVAFEGSVYKTHYTILIKKAFKDIVRKGENAGNQDFPLFPQCFPLFHS